MGVIANFMNKVLSGKSLGWVPSLDSDPCQATRLSGYSALYSMAYLACEQSKARSLGSLPVSVYERSPDGRTQLYDHPLTGLLAGMANEAMSGQDLLHWASLRRDTFGNAYIYVEWRRGEPVALWPVYATVTPEWNKHAPVGKRLTYLVAAGDDFVPSGRYFSDEIVNVKTSVTKNGYEGVSLAKMAASEVGLSVDLESFYSAMLTNGNHQLGHVEVPDGRTTPEDLESLKRAIEAKRGIAEAGKAPIFSHGAKWVTTQQTMKDASLIEQQTWVLQQVCRATCVPPQKIYDATSQTYNNGETSRIDYATDTVSPEAVAIQKAFVPVLRSMGSASTYLHFNLGGLMRGDKKSQSSYYREMVYLGAMTRNDVREKEEMNPLPGLDKPMVALNYGLVEEDGSVTVLSKDATEPSDGNQTATTDKQQ